MARFLSLVLACALACAVIATYLAPRVISALFTPPVSFGTNCEPAADWAMQKMVSSQSGGLLVGALFGAVMMIFMKSRGGRKANPNDKPTAGA
ncbi:MAG: hypothetical protein IOD12_02655 [Silvanigrellales bacterium]|nr:hypothetical protein [Silvanigrellales bacterium]